MARPEPKDIYPLLHFAEDFASRVRRNHEIRYCFVIGAGASRSSGIPTGAALVDEWLRLRFEQDCPKASRDDIKPWAEDTFKRWDNFTWDTRAAFYGRIYEWYHLDDANGQDALRQLTHGKSPSFGYAVLARILANTNHKVVLTTNFDNLVRDAIQLHVPGEVPYIGHGREDAKFLAGHANRIRIAKLHGDIDRKNYQPRPDIGTLHEVWGEALRGIFMYYTPIFIGYGGNDPCVMEFIHEQMTINQFRARPIWAYRVDPESQASAGEDDPVRPGWPAGNAIQKFMEQHGGFWLPIPGFDELMMLLGNALDYGNQAALIRGEADRLAQNYERSLAETAKSLRQIRCRGWCPQLPDLADVAEQKLLGQEKGRTWNDWRVALEAAPLRAERRRLLEEAIRDLKSNPELKAYYAAFLAEEMPFASEVDTLMQEAKVQTERSLGAESTAMSTFLHHLATIHELRGQAAACLKIASEVFRRRKIMLGEEHPDTLKTSHLIANALSDQGNYVAAEKRHRQVLEIRERTLGNEHWDTLSSANNLANALSDQGNHAQAEELHRRVLQVRERTLGREHPDTLKSINNLANALSGQGNYAEAQKLFLRVLEARERTLGREHPDTFSSLNNLANVFFDQGNHAEAERLYRQTLEFQERTLGPEHPDTLGSLNNLALALTKQGNYAAAGQLHRRILEVYERTLGKDHPNTQRTRRNLAQAQAKQQEQQVEQQQAALREQQQPQEPAAEEPVSQEPPEQQEQGEQQQQGETSSTQ